MGVYELPPHVLLAKQDLDRAKAAQSSGVFILANQFSNSPNDDDSSYMLAAISIKRYCKTQVSVCLRFGCHDPHSRSATNRMPPRQLQPPHLRP